MRWTARDMPVLSGRRAVVTGATSGLGFETAAALAACGAEVTLVGRNPQKGQAALERLRGRASPELVRFEMCDQADPDQVRGLAGRLLDQGGALDILVNNAGLMAPPERRVTAEGVELQFQVNYLSHFALTGLLLPLLKLASGARVVSLASAAVRFGALDFGDLQNERYDAFRAYGRSKTAMLMFALALERRSKAKGWRLSSYAAHPGWAATGLMEPEGAGGSFAKSMIALATPMIAQSAAQGALPTLYAATAREALPGGYYGPDGLGEIRGHPAPAKIAPFAADKAAQDRLWAESVRLSGVDWG